MDSLEISKKKYDQAKANVKSLSEEFKKLQSQLQEQVSNLQSARSNLVSQIASVQGIPKNTAYQGSSPNSFVIKAEQPASVDSDSDEEDQAEFTSNPSVDHLRDSSAALASAGSASDAAESAQHALHYTEQVASRVGDLADQSEEQAERIVDAARLTQASLSIFLLCTFSRVTHFGHECSYVPMNRKQRKPCKRLSNKAAASSTTTRTRRRSRLMPQLCVDLLLLLSGHNLSTICTCNVCVLLCVMKRASHVQALPAFFALRTRPRTTSCFCAPLVVAYLPCARPAGPDVLPPPAAGGGAGLRLRVDGGPDHRRLHEGPPACRPS